METTLAMRSGMCSAMVSTIMAPVEMPVKCTLEVSTQRLASK